MGCWILVRLDGKAGNEADLVDRGLVSGPLKLVVPEEAKDSGDLLSFRPLCGWQVVCNAELGEFARRVTTIDDLVGLMVDITAVLQHVKLADVR